YLSTYLSLYMFFFIDPSTSEIYTLSLHDALPILVAVAQSVRALDCGSRGCGFNSRQPPSPSSKVRPVSTCVTGAWRRRGVAPPLRPSVATTIATPLHRRSSSRRYGATLSLGSAP